MRKDLVDITLVIDKSGSMAKLTNDTIGGVNKLLADQRKVEGEARVSIILFNTYTHVLCNGELVNSAPDLTSSNYHPSGNTALLDAVGYGITTTGRRLAAMKEENRPGKVIFVIVTDGEENSSRTYTKQQVKQMIEEQTSKYSWEFTYLGANVDAFHEASSLGISWHNVSNYGANTKGVDTVYTVASEKIANLRSLMSGGASAQSVNMAFSDEDKNKLEATVNDN